MVDPFVTLPLTRECGPALASALQSFGNTVRGRNPM
jgi:hypothetical protein